MAYKSVSVVTALIPIEDFDKIPEEEHATAGIERVIGFVVAEGERATAPIKTHDLREAAETHLVSLRNADPGKPLRLWAWLVINGEEAGDGEETNT